MARPCEKKERGRGSVVFPPRVCKEKKKGEGEKILFMIL
jgi:hypothetical protein